MIKQPEPLIFEVSSPGRTAYTLPDLDVPQTPLPDGYVRDDLNLPEVSELELVRHYTRLSQKNYSIDSRKQRRQFFRNNYPDPQFRSISYQGSRVT